MNNLIFNEMMVRSALF